MAAVNCWEFKKCGRQPGGDKVPELGVCPAATYADADGFLGGKNAGRACAYVEGTFCSGTIEGTHKDKEKNCAKCDFYRLLRSEHGADCSVISFAEHARVKNRRAAG